MELSNSKTLTYFQAGFKKEPLRNPGFHVPEVEQDVWKSNRRDQTASYSVFLSFNEFHQINVVRQGDFL